MEAAGTAAHAEVVLREFVVFTLDAKFVAQVPPRFAGHAAGGVLTRRAGVVTLAASV